MQYPPKFLILGAGRKRVGYQVALHLAHQGWQPLLHYRTDHAERQEIDAALRDAGTEPIWFQADLACEKDVEAMFAQIDRDAGRIDAMVHAAAIWKPVPWDQITANDIEENYRANQLGTLLPSLAAGKRMVRQRDGGTIILMGDWAVARPYRNYLAYFASKGSIPTITRALAVELGTANPRVRVNCIEPGPVLLPPEMAEVDKKAVIDATLVRREGSPQEVALAVWGLIQNPFITGVCLPVDGGRSIWAGGL